MTNQEVREVKQIYQEYLIFTKKIAEFKDKVLECKPDKKLLKLLPYKQIERIKIKDNKEILRKIYIEKAKKSKKLFNIKVYMGSYYSYNGPDRDENALGYLDDLLTFENDPRAVYRVFCDIESTWDNREEVGEFIYYSSKGKLEEYEQENTIIVAPNEEIKKSIIEASKYSDCQRYHGVNRYFGLYGTMDKSIGFNIKGDIDSFGDLVPLQNYFFSLLMSMQPEEAVAQLIKKYKPYRNFYDYNNIEK